MERYFEWETFWREKGRELLVTEMPEELFLLDLEKEDLWLTQRTAELLADRENPLPPHVPLRQFEGLLNEQSLNALRQEIQRIRMDKVRRGSCHASVHSTGGDMSAVVYLFLLEGVDGLLGFISVDYEPLKEYSQQMERLTQEVEHLRAVNELTMEGALDYYIYQMDLEKNIGTISSKALEILPLESTTFSDALNRFLSFIVPEDRQVFLDSLIPILSGQSDLHEAEYRIRTKQGNIVWISCHGKCMHAPDGRPQMMAGAMLDITEQKKHEEEISRMLYYDMMTGLQNRLQLERDMEARLREEDAHGSLLFLDIRRFKLYNELFGHGFGDQVLREFANILKLYFPGALGIYHYNGDEFIIHLEDDNPRQILGRLSPLLAVLKNPREIDGHTLYINVYAAVVIYPEDGRTVDELLNNMNQCHYRMSRESKEAVGFFTPENKDKMPIQFLLENEMRKDIEDGFRHFRMVYQPLVRLDGQGAHWIGAEALLRYRNPDFPSLGQMEMIHTLEYSGLILPVGRWVVSQAVHECRRWNVAGRRAIVHVNVAAQQIADGGLVNYIKDCCEAEGLPADRLVVELTETSLLNSFEMATHFCEELLKMGVGVALDDFGTGYSNFNYLRNLPLTEIKVDREYAKQIPVSRYNQIIVSFLHSLSEDLELDLCVEGVETEDELNELKKMGISQIQGFYFERPLEADVMRREFPEKSKSVG